MFNRSTRNRNFVAMNRVALTKGLTNSREQQNMWATGEGPEVVKKRYKIKKVKAPPVPEGFTFGKPSRGRDEMEEPDTFDSSVGVEVDAQQYLMDRYYEQQAQQERQQGPRSFNNFKNIRSTRTVEMRNKVPMPNEDPLWQMSKFKGVRSRVSTFRTETAKNRAMDSHALDAPLREGQLGFGQGVTKNPAGTSRNL